MILAKKANAEFGWFLMRWQGHLRYLSQKHKVKVECEDWQRYLVSDFEYTGEPEDEVTEVHYTKRLQRKKHLKQEFIRYGVLGSHPGYDVVIHARNLNKGVHRNWPDEKWQELVKELNGYQVAFVGTYDRARCWGEDKRGVPLEELCNIMCNSDLFIGESSGPAHLASLCGLNHLVITDRRRWRVGWKKSRNWNRYVRDWNPLGTPAYVLDQDDYNPPVAKVLRAIEKNGLL